MIKTEIIPVIHMLNENQVLTNVKTCVECGIEKVFIINNKRAGTCFKIIEYNG